jgi:hypothetical protein
VTIIFFILKFIFWLIQCQVCWEKSAFGKNHHKTSLTRWEN